MWTDFSSLQDDIQLSQDQIEREYRFYSEVYQIFVNPQILVLSYVIFHLFCTWNFLLLTHKIRTIKFAFYSQ